MTHEINQRRMCRRVTKQRLPCLNKSLIGGDYCFVHSISVRRGGAYYAGLLGSIASVIGLIIVFWPKATTPNESTTPASKTAVQTLKKIGQAGCTSDIQVSIGDLSGDFLDYSKVIKFQLLIANTTGEFIALNSIKITFDGESWDDRVILKIPEEYDHYPNPFIFSIEPKKQGRFDVYYKTTLNPDSIKAFIIKVGYIDSHILPNCINAFYANRLPPSAP